MDKVETKSKHCGEKFYADLHDIKKGKSTYCSKTCFYEECRKRRCKHLDCNKAHFGLGYCRKHYRQLPEVKKRENKRTRIYAKENVLLLKRRVKNHQIKIRNKLLLHYSDGTLKCAKCGFDDVRALEIDHINNDGNKDRKKYGRKAYCFYIDLAKKLPEGYQVLCKNCNWIKYIETLRERIWQ